MRELSLLEWQLIPWKNKDYTLQNGGRFWLKIKGKLIEIKVKLWQQQDKT